MARDLTDRMEHVFVTSGLIQSYAKLLKQPLDALFSHGPGRPLKLFLNGTWLEHPLHPLLTDVVVGAWTVALLLDLLALIFHVTGLGLASAIAVGLGVLAALASIVTGLMDWVDLDPDELAVGVTHGTINIIATLLFAVSFFLRSGAGWAIDALSFVIALAGYLVVSLGAFIGGSLVFRMGVMVNRNAYRRGTPKNFVAVMALKDLPENKPVRVMSRDEPVMLVRRGERIFAIGAVCSHLGAPLEKGELKDGTIECPWHGSQFALADGSLKSGPATAPVPCYETRVTDGQVELKRIKAA